MLWKPYEEKFKWAVAVQKFFDSSSQYLNLDVGDVVYIRRYCADWYYGFKANQASKCGAFPKICVAPMRNQLSAELSAELQIMFSKLLTSFMATPSFPLDQVLTSLNKTVDLKDSLNGKLTKYETMNTLKKLLLSLACTQRELSLPILVRDDQFEPVNPYVVSLVDFHQLHHKAFKEIKDARLSTHTPTTKRFNIRLVLENIPQAELTLYLASQPITLTGESNGVVGVNGGPTTDQVNVLQGQVTNTGVQYGSQINRLTENVVISGYDRTTEEVTFVDLDPIHPRDERILLLVVIHRIGYMHVKRSRSSIKGNLPPPAPIRTSWEDSSLRRPHGVACVDISRELVQQAASSWPGCSGLSLGSDPATCVGRTVPIIATGEQFLSDALLQLVKDTPSSLWSTQPARDPSVVQLLFTSAAGSSVVSNSSLAGDTREPEIADFCLKSVEVLNQLQSELYASYPLTDRTLGRRYGLTQLFSWTETPSRKEVYVNLISGDFFRGPKKQEKNIEVEISLRDNTGKLKSLSGPDSCTESRVFRSTVYYHKNHPRWSELFAIPLPPSSNSVPKSADSMSTHSRNSAFTESSMDEHWDQIVPGGLAGDHLRFVCRHKSTTNASKDKLLGVAFLRLQPSTSIPVLLADGVYQLIVHRMDLQQIEACAYLRESSILSGPGLSGSSSSGSQGSIGMSNILSSSSLSAFTSSRQRHEYVSVETRLCSHEHTTDENLTKILFWQKYQEDLVMCLRQGVYLSRKDAELRKFLRPLLDRLIQILDSSVNSTNGFPQLNVSLGYSVLMALARCYHDLLIQQTHQEVVKAYLNSPSFHYPGVYRPYLRLLNSVLQDVLSTTNGSADVNGARRYSNPESTCHMDSKAVQVICSKIYWAFLVIVRSRQLELSASESSSDCSDEGFFIHQVDLFFTQAQKLVLLNENRILRPILLKHIPEIFKDLSTVYPVTRLAGFVAPLIERTLECCELPNHKILVETIHSALFEECDARQLLLPVMLRSLTKFFADSLNKELTSGRTETDVRMECWCEALLSFVSRFRQLTASNRPEPESVPLELRALLIRDGFLRWVMQQLARTLIFIQQEGSRSGRHSGLETVDHLGLGRTHSWDAVSLQVAAAERLRPILGCLTSVLLTLLQELDPPCWIELLFGTNPSGEESTTDADHKPPCGCAICTRLQLMDLYDFTHELFTLFSMLHQCPPYHAPSRLVGTPAQSVQFGDSWIELLIAASHAELKTIKLLVDIVIVPLCTGSEFPVSLPATPPSSLKPDHPFSMELIIMVQDCLCSFATLQLHLCVETLPGVIQSRVNLAMLGEEDDMRQLACNQLLAIWNAIGDQYKSQYIPLFLPSIIDMATIAIPALRNTCVSWVFDAIRVNPSAVERDFVSEVDRVMQWAGTGFAVDLSRLLEDRLFVMQNNSDKKLDSSAERLTRDLIRQLNCLLAYGEFLDHRSKLNEMLALHNLRTVYEKNGRDDMVLRYLYRLESLHSKCGNEIERGNTLEAISKYYAWSDDPVDRPNVSRPYLPYACISSRALRERLLLDSLECLKRGTDWERAIEVCDQLIELYRDIAPNYSKLGLMLSEQADLYQRIVSSQHVRTPYHYYLLIFSGPGFAPFIVDRFVYRTSADSTEVLRILAEEFPQATRLTTPPGPDHIPDHPVICALGNLIPQASVPEHLSGHGVDSRIKSYYMRNRVNCFTHLRHLKPTVTRDGREQPAAEETRYFVADCFPNTMPIVPVIRTETSFLDPIQFATINVQEILRRLEQHLPVMSETTDQKNLNPMIGTLTSSILSPVSGGLPKLLGSLEFTDDAGQESNFSKLSDTVLDLLEMQLVWLEFWYKMDPPPPADTIADTSSTGGNVYLQNTVKAYEPLVRDMSRIFGFSVDHLKVDHLLYGPAATSGTVERRSSSGTVNLRQPASFGCQASAQPSPSSRVFHRWDSIQPSDLPISSSTLRVDRSRAGSRPSWDHGSAIFGECLKVTSPVAPTAPDSISTILSTEPPPLPDRPTALHKPDSMGYLVLAEDGSNQPEDLSLKRLPPRPVRSSHRPGESDSTAAHDEVAPPLPPRPPAAGAR